jgi:histidinol phosphatase-like enzyme (inositol monophosphatase family)
LIEDFIAAAETAADVAAAAVRPFFRARLSVDQKSDASPVTIADRSAELAMRGVLSQRFPDHSVFGEEFGTLFPPGNPAPRYRWVLDPVDGTRAFVTGRPQFGTLIALLDGETPILGVIDQPITGERWIGAAGQRTRFLGQFGRVGTRDCAGLAEAELSCTSPEIFGPDLPRWEKLRARAKRATYGGDCYAYGLLALGQIDIVAEATMQFWDWAALVPIIEGAGGSVTDWNGAPLRPDGDGRVLALGDPSLLAEAIAALAP